MPGSLFESMKKKVINFFYSLLIKYLYFIHKLLTNTLEFKNMFFTPFYTSGVAEAIGSLSQTESKPGGDRTEVPYRPASQASLPQNYQRTAKLWGKVFLN